VRRIVGGAEARAHHAFGFALALLVADTHGHCFSEIATGGRNARIGIACPAVS